MNHYQLIKNRQARPKEESSVRTNRVTYWALRMALYENYPEVSPNRVRPDRHWWR